MPQIDPSREKPKYGSPYPKGSPLPPPSTPLRGATETAFYGYDVRAPVGGEQQTTPKPSRQQPTTGGGFGTVSTMPVSPTGGTETSYWQPPARPAPTFAAPKYDEREIRKLTQRYAAAPTRRLRETIRRIAGQQYGSPMVRRMTLREALEGYGTALESVMAGAGRAAAGEYAGRYAREFQAAQIGFQSLYNQWMQEGKQVSAKKYTYDMPPEATGGPGPNMMKVMTQAGTYKWIPRT